MPCGLASALCCTATVLPLARPRTLPPPSWCCPINGGERPREARARTCLRECLGRRMKKWQRRVILFSFSLAICYPACVVAPRIRALVAFANSHPRPNGRGDARLLRCSSLSGLHMSSLQRKQWNISLREINAPLPFPHPAAHSLSLNRPVRPFPFGALTRSSTRRDFSPPRARPRRWLSPSEGRGAGGGKIRSS